MLWAPEDDGLTCEVASDLDTAMNGAGSAPPDAVLLDMDALSEDRGRKAASHCKELGVPVLAVLSSEDLGWYNPWVELDDFILHPLRRGELSARVSQAIFRTTRPQQSSNTLAVGHLLIDMERYEVRLEGKRVNLTYKEYQLLVLLASNPGRVYTRDSLLSQVWGYDYYGGTRTVDVHIRRLRSKIEDGGEAFIETIWNVGYRFKSGD